LDRSLNNTPPGGGFGNGSAQSSRPSSLGLTTGTTWQGNTAFGPAGGMATGYATRSPMTGRVDTGSSTFAAPNTRGGGVGAGTYSNFRTPDGSAMFGGSLQGQGVMAGNAIQALGMLRAMQAAQARPQPAGGPTMVQPGLLDEELPIDAVPEIPSIPPNLSITGPGSFWNPGYWMNNPTNWKRGEQRPAPLNWSDASGWPGQGSVPRQPSGNQNTQYQNNQGGVSYSGATFRPGDYRGGNGVPGGGYGGGAGGGW
jgi:hypothetical protein